MTARRLLALLLIVAGTACGDDPEGPIIIPPPPITGKSVVLHNLQLAYNERNITQYERILDNGFTFFLAESDVNNGLPAQWDRSEEITLNTRLFSRTKQPSDPWPLCTDINLDVQFEHGPQWIEVIPSSAPNELWYSTIVYYDFEIDVEPDTQFRATSGARAQFTVRNVGTDDGPQWRLVEWRDLGSGSLVSAASRTGPDETTWGGVKARYGGQP